MIFVACNLPGGLDFVDQIARVNKEYYITILTTAIHSEITHYTSHSKHIYHLFICIYICIGSKMATNSKKGCNKVQGIVKGPC